MKKVLIAAITLAMAGAASAAIPQLNYQCPGQIQMHSDEGAGRDHTLRFNGTF